MSLKDFGFALGGIAAIAALSTVRSRASMSRVESDEYDDDGDDDSMEEVREGIERYARTAEMLGFYAAQQSDDLEEIGNEASLDIGNESVKALTRKRSPLIVPLGYSPSFSFNSFEGLPRAFADEWTGSPAFRFRVMYAAALQARSAYDKLSRIPSHVVLGTPEQQRMGKSVSTVPSEALLFTFARAMEQSATEAIQDIASAAPQDGDLEFNDQIEALTNMKNRAERLVRMHKAKMQAQAEREKR